MLPLPMRDGVSASQVALPVGPWTCMLDFLVERFPAISSCEWSARLACGDVVDGAGRPVTPDERYVPLGKLYYYRTVANEAPNAAQANVLFEDEILVVADKPHFLPVTPSGRYLQETLLIRLRRQLDAPELTPLHRIDRETAGVVMFAKHPKFCAAFQKMFLNREIAKQYEAIARSDPQMTFPVTRSSKLVDGDHFMQMREVDASSRAAANSHSEIELMETRGEWARYQLRPLSGKRHQLRVHMAALGLPILGDRIYPKLLAQGGDALDNPLRLLAARVEFRDPFTGEERQFASERKLYFPEGA